MIIIDDVYAAAMQAIERAGGYRVDENGKSRIRKRSWFDGEPNRESIAKDADAFSRVVGLRAQAASARFFTVRSAEAANPCNSRNQV